MTETDWRFLGAQGAQALAQGRPAEAARIFEQVIAIAPDHADSWFNLGYARRQARDYPGALAAYAEALSRGISAAEGVHVNRALILSDHLDQVDEAEAELRRAVDLAPRFVPAWTNLGMLYEDVGRREAASEAYRSALAADPRCARAHARLAALDEDRAAAVSRLERLVGHGGFAGEDAAELEFALGNALDAVGRFDEAFTAIERANARMAALRPSQARYDRARHEALVDSLIAAYPAHPIGNAEAGDRRPVFVCGMFRSGSTVAEQLLARHPEITAGGELDIIPAMVAERLQPYPAAAAALDAETRDELRREYLATIEALFPGASYVTDKRPDNFLHLGLIKTLFPDAVIVHTARDPLDVAVSTYFLNFAEAVSYSEHLGDIGHYLAQYERLMRHWERVFGEDIVRVEYETLVVDPGSALAPVFSALGLDPGAVREPSDEGAIRTPSAWAARSPLNTRSVGRWQHYADKLAPLRDALGK